MFHFVGGNTVCLRISMASSQHGGDIAWEAHNAEHKQLRQDLQRVEQLVAEGEGRIGVDSNHLQQDTEEVIHFA